MKLSNNEKIQLKAKIFTLIALIFLVVGAYTAGYSSATIDNAHEKNVLAKNLLDKMDDDETITITLDKKDIVIAAHENNERIWIGIIGLFAALLFLSCYVFMSFFIPEVKKYEGEK